jgi:hypothetical protein
LDEASYEIVLPDGPFPPPRLIKGKPVRVSPYESGGSSLFPKDHEIFDSVVLQVTDFQSNFNKYYRHASESNVTGKRRERERERELVIFVLHLLMISTLVWSFIMLK